MPSRNREPVSQPHTWTRLERIGLVLIFHEEEYNLNRADGYRLACATFQALADGGHHESHVYEQWSQRFAKGRNKDWYDISRPNARRNDRYTAIERAEQANIRQLLQNAAQQIGMMLPPPGPGIYHESGATRPHPTTTTFDTTQPTSASATLAVSVNTSSALDTTSPLTANTPIVSSTTVPNSGKTILPTSTAPARRKQTASEEDSMSEPKRPKPRVSRRPRYVDSNYENSENEVASSSTTRRRKPQATTEPAITTNSRVSTETQGTTSLTPDQDPLPFVRRGNVRFDGGIAQLIQGGAHANSSTFGPLQAEQAYLAGSIVRLTHSSGDKEDVMTCSPAACNCSGDALPTQQRGIQGRAQGIPFVHLKDLSQCRQSRFVIYKPLEQGPEGLELPQGDGAIQGPHTIIMGNKEWKKVFACVEEKCDLCRGNVRHRCEKCDKQGVRNGSGRIQFVPL